MMARQIPIAIGAGLASALLAASLLSGTSLAFSLFLLTPLPIALAGLGWGSLTGALAAVISGTALGAASEPSWGFLLILVLAGPAAWLAHLAGLWRAGAESPEQREWYPMGRILLHAVALVSAALIAAGFIFAYDPAALVEQLVGAIQPPDAEELRPLIRSYVGVMPYQLAAMCLFSLVFGLWLAGRITLLSGRLARPWMPLWTVDLPPVVGAVFVLSLAVSLVPGVGLVAAPIAGASGFALVLLGLAVVHAITRGRPKRTARLTLTYIVTFFFLPALAVVGLVEVAAGIRRRFANHPNV